MTSMPDIQKRKIIVRKKLATEFHEAYQKFFNEFGNPIPFEISDRSAAANAALDAYESKRLQTICDQQNIKHSKK